MKAIIITGIAALFFWAVFQYSFSRDRSKYRNCYFLFLALASTLPLIINVAGEDYGNTIAVHLINTIFWSLLVVPFFLIINGIVMLRKEGRQPSHLLSLALGIIVLIGEIVTAALVLSYSFAATPVADEVLRSWWFIAGVMTSATVIYGSMAFVIFMIYILFLQALPKKKDFDYVIIHGAGLLHGEKISRLLQSRLDKAIAIYRKDPTPPKLIPSGGKGDDERLPEAEAMMKYLLEHGIPAEDIIMEDQSKTTYENLAFSKKILDAREGRKYTALVTSNYHVYRALRYCRKIGLPCTGIGSRVAFYYWPSALIREFIAIHAERKHAIVFAAGWLLCMAAVTLPFLM